jgi:hypothetical protein
MIGTITTLLKSIAAPTGVRTVLAAAAIGAIPTAALADRHDYDRPAVHVDVDLHRPQPRVEERATRVWVEPVYQTVSDRHWVEPVYRTVTEHVWVAPVTQTVNDRVWVPERVERRDVVRYEHGRRFVRDERVVTPGHYENTQREVAVTPGHYEDVQRQECVTEGHWETVTHQECVTPGHWETRLDQVVSPRDRGLRFDVRLP